MKSRLTALFASAIAFFIASSALAQLGAQWDTVHPKPSGRAYFDLAAAGSQIVAVGDKIIDTTSDGVTWSSKFDVPQLFRVRHGPQGYVAFDFDGEFWSSPDGVAWSSRIVGESEIPQDILWDGSRWAGFYYSNAGFRLAVSSDQGLNWHAVGVPVPGVATQIVWTGTSYIVVGSDADTRPLVASTTNGMDWTVQVLGKAGEAIGTLCTGGAVSVVMTNSQVWVSNDARTWRAAASYAAPGAWLIWTGTQFVMVGTDLQDSQVSTDGDHWSPRTVTHSLPAYTNTKVVWSGTQAVAWGEGGTVFTSPDGIDWTRIAPLTEQQAFVAVASNGLGRTVAVGNEHGLAWSDDRVVWHDVIGADTNAPNAVVWDGTAFIAMGNLAAYTSADGIAWTDIATDTMSTFDAFSLAVDTTPSSPALIATGTDYSDSTAAMLRSTDHGATWTRLTLPSGVTDLGVVAHFATGWVAAADAGLILRSTDGVNWTKGGTLKANTFKASCFAFNGTTYLAGTRGGHFFTSTDLVKWTERIAPTAWKYSSALWTGSQFVLVGDYGGEWAVQASTDGVTWKDVYSEPSSVAPNATIWDGMALISVTARGLIRVSYGTPAVSFSVASQTVIEGAGAAVARVELSFAPTSTVTIPITPGGTASSGTDFTAPAASLVFNAGEAAKFVSVPIAADTDGEPDETITLTLGTPSGARSGSTLTHTITIQDDDGPPPVNFLPVPAMIGEGGSFSVGVALEWPSATAVTVPVSASGSATSGLDYNGVPASLTFAPGETMKQFVVSGVADMDSELDETVTLSLGTLSGATPGTITSVTCTLIEDFGPDRAWQSRAPRLASGGFTAIASSPVRTVIVGGYGAIFSSDDQGVTWVRRFTGPVIDEQTPEYADAINAVVWTGTQFIAVDDHGGVITSPDGVSWVRRSIAGAERIMLFSVASNGTRTVVAGYDGVNGDDFLACSSDGQHWAVSRWQGKALHSVVWNGAQFYAAGWGGVLAAADGAQWQPLAVQGWPAGTWHMLWTGTQFVVTEFTGGVATSPDGLLWTKHKTGSSSLLMGGAQNGTTTLLVGKTTVTSTNGTAWAVHASGSPNPLKAVTWTGSKYLAVSAGGTVLASTDGKAWTGLVTPLGGADFDLPLRAVVWTGTQFVATGAGAATANSARSLTSPDGQTWTPHTLTGTTPVISLAWSGKLLAGVTDANTVSTSVNGLSWTKRSAGLTAASQKLKAVCWTGSQFVAVGGSAELNESIVLTSPDGIKWTRRSVPCVAVLRCVASDGALIIAAGDEGELLTSPDGVTWTRRASGLPGVVIRGVAFGGTGWVIVGDPGYEADFGQSAPRKVGGYRMASSPDATLWTAVPGAQLPQAIDTRLRGVCWRGQRFAAVGDSGTVLTSADGQHWRSESLPGTLSLRAIAFNGAVSVAVGENGAVVTNGSGAPPAPVVEFAASSTNLGESAGGVDVLVTITPAPSTMLSVPVVVDGASTVATTGAEADVTLPGSPLILQPGETRKLLHIVVKNDHLPEGSETLVLRLQAPASGASIGTQSTHTLTITDNDTAPTIPSGGAPQHQLVPLGSALALNVTATGDAPLSYVWKKNGKAIAGAATATFYKPKAALIDAGTYTVIVTNAAGTASATVEVGVFETVVRNIANPASKGAVLTQTAAGNGLSFAWYKDGSATPYATTPPRVSADATGKTITFKTLEAGDNGQYRCQVLQTTSSQLWNANTYNVTLVSAAPALDPLALPAGQVGIYYSQTIPPGTGSGVVAAWSASNLPAGLSIDPQTGDITGYPTTVGTRTVTITATNGLKSAKVSAPLSITAIHPGLIGTSAGVMQRSSMNRQLGTRVQLDLTAQGTFTGSYTAGTVKQSFSGQAVADSTTTAHGSAAFDVAGRNAVLSFTFDAAAHPGTTGTLTLTTPGTTSSETASFTTSRPHSSASTYAGRFTFTIELQGTAIGDLAYPQSHGFGTALITSNGAVTFTGRSGDTASYSCTSFINTEGSALLYASLYGSGGTLSGVPHLTLNASPSPTDQSTINDVALTWNKLPDTSAAGARTYASGWAPLTVNLEGMRYAAPDPGLTVLDDYYAPGSSATYLTFTGPRLGRQVTFELSTTGTRVVRPFADRYVTFTAVPATGVFSGTYALIDTLPTGSDLKRSFPFYGVVVRRDDVLAGGVIKRGYGACLVPRLPAFLSAPLPASSSTLIDGCDVLLSLDP